MIKRMNSSLSGITGIFSSLRGKEKEFVLATIVETRGSTYRKAGARLLITRSGKFFGLLGGGCFEADLLEHAMEVFEKKKSHTVFYDMRGPEDLVWGLGLGCNGAVKIRLEYLSADNNYEPLFSIQKGLDLKRKCVIATVCDSSHPSWPADRHVLVTFSDDPGNDETLPEAIMELAIKTLYTGTPVLEKVEAGNHSLELFMAPVIPPLQFLIIGGGPDSIPVINNATLLGWDVTVVDYRDGYSNPENFPRGIRVIKSTPEDLGKKIDLGLIDAVVLMTHKFEYDLRYLKNFIETGITYIGLLGPTARKDELLRSLEEPPPEFTGRIYGPVGLNLGGELPEEIALSLIAEIQAVFNKRPGSHLSGNPIADSGRVDSGDLSVIVLAAGGSSRFGALKQLLEYKGKSFLKRAVETSLALKAKEVLVIHGPKATKCQREVSGYEVSNIVNYEWEAGMSSSLVLGIRSISSESKAVLVLLCDQPLIGQAQLEQLISLWRNNPDRIVASEYGGTTGVPAIIPAAYFEEMKKLAGDTGAKKIIANHADTVLTMAVPEAEIDIDTENDFSELLRKKQA